MQSSAWIDEKGKLVTEGLTIPVPWWSFTKTVLALAALRLVEQGHLSLTAPVEGKAYTLEQLLRHEAGLPDYGSASRYHEDVTAGKLPWSQDYLFDVMEVDRARYTPGEGWTYSNIGYLKVGLLIEQASGLFLGEALNALVFQPFDLTSAWLATTPQDLKGVEMGDAIGYHPGWVYHGLVTGTTADAARLLHALLAGKILERASLAAMVKGRPLPEHRSANYPDPAYGFGLMLWATDPVNHPIGHTGNGVGSNIAVYGQAGRTGAIWTSSSSPLDPVAEVFRRLPINPA